MKNKTRPDKIVKINGKSVKVSGDLAAVLSVTSGKSSTRYVALTPPVK